MKKNKENYDFKDFGQAIKAARKAKGYSRNALADELNIAPRYIASIENSGQHPRLQIFYELVTLFDVSVDTFFFPDVKSLTMNSVLVYIQTVSCGFCRSEIRFGLPGFLEL